jgi:hypothetical protein
MDFLVWEEGTGVALWRGTNNLRHFSTDMAYTFTSEEWYKLQELAKVYLDQWGLVYDRSKGKLFSSKDPTHAARFTTDQLIDDEKAWFVNVPYLGITNKLDKRKRSQRYQNQNLSPLDNVIDLEKVDEPVVSQYDALINRAVDDQCNIFAQVSKLKPGELFSLMIGNKQRNLKLCTFPMTNMIVKTCRKAKFLLTEQCTIDDADLNVYQYVLLDILCVQEYRTRTKRCYCSMTYCSSENRINCFCLKIGLRTNNRDEMDMWILDLDTSEVVLVKDFSGIKLYCCDRNREVEEAVYRKYLDIFKQHLVSSKMVYDIAIGCSKVDLPHSNGLYDMTAGKCRKEVELWTPMWHSNDTVDSKGKNRRNTTVTPPVPTVPTVPPKEDAPPTKGKLPTRGSAKKPEPAVAVEHANSCIGADMINTPVFEELRHLRNNLSNELGQIHKTQAELGKKMLSNEKQSGVNTGSGSAECLRIVELSMIQSKERELENALRTKEYNILQRERESELMKATAEKERFTADNNRQQLIDMVKATADISAARDMLESERASKREESEYERTAKRELVEAGRLEAEVTRADRRESKECERNDKREHAAIQASLERE